MDGENLSVDQREQQPVGDELLISRLRARQLCNLAGLDVAQVAWADGTRPDLSWRKATVLVDTVTAGDPPPVPVTVFVDARDAVPTDGETGVVLEAGPRVGRQALESMFCDATTEVVAPGRLTAGVWNTVVDIGPHPQR